MQYVHVTRNDPDVTGYLESCSYCMALKKTQNVLKTFSFILYYVQ